MEYHFESWPQESTGVYWHIRCSRAIGRPGELCLDSVGFSFPSQQMRGGLLISWAMARAFDDNRFTPIILSELPTLAVSVTLLTNFTPALHPNDWELGVHGIRISFSHHGKRHGATYLPDVAVEQGWTKEQTIVSLMRKAGWIGRSADWKKVQDLRIVKYQGKKTSIGYRDFRDWRGWVDAGR